MGQIKNIKLHIVTDIKMMENLPEELLSSILGRCYFRDIRNLACCGREYFDLVKPILWRAVRILLSSLSTKLGFDLENLKHTKHLAIKEDFSNHASGADDNQGSENDLNARRKAVDIGFNLAQLIGCCDPTKVEFLDSDLNGVGFERILERFDRLKCLRLSIKGDVDGKVLNNLAHLEELEVSHSPSLVGHHDQFWCAIVGERIRELKIHFYGQLSDGVVAHIGKWTNLESLTLLNRVLNFQTIRQNLGPITGLENLTFLRLYQYSIRSDDLKQLCRCLKKLKTLDLDHSQLTNDALSEMDSLKSLTRLDLYGCEGISSRCFKHLNTLPLQSISFSADICVVTQGGVMRSGGIAWLNKLATLKQVSVFTDRGEKGRTSLAVISNSLCYEETWMTRLEQYGVGDEYLSTFTR